MQEVTNDIWKDNDYRNLVELFETALKKFSNNRLFGTKNSQGIYEWVTYAEVGERVKNFRSGLATLGISKGKKVGIISKNSTEWAVAEMATLSLGAIFVPMYEKELLSMWEYVIKDAEIEVLIVRTGQIYEKVQNLKDKIPTLKHIIIVEGNNDNSMQNIELKQVKKTIDPIYPEPKEVAVIIYTSGTTGDPKGVLLSHGNLCFASQAGYHLYPNLTEQTVSFSHLPWAHSYAIAAELHNGYQFGGSCGFMDTLDAMVDDLQKVKPTVLMSVPRVFNKVYQAIHTTMKEEGGMKLKLFNAAVEAAKERFLTGKTSFKYKILDKMVLDKIREKFGGRLEMALTASAKMNEEIALFFYSIGIPTYDAYGMTETSPVVTMNAPDAYRFGSVGKPVEKTKVVIDKSVIDDENSEDGEIVVYGPQVMLGYHKKPEKTKQIMTEDRGIRTGDRGKLDEDGFLFITGRIKEQYKLENGKYVFPAQIEEDIKLLPYIANAFVYGDGRQYNVCILVLDAENITSWAAEMQINLDPEELLTGLSKSGAVLKKIVADEVSKHLMQKYAKYEIPKKYLFTTEDFTVENRKLTQTMKVKRREILSEYKEEIEELYTLPLKSE
ncbi:MAG: AMP-binding protein [Candidatus Lokiarchaeota archaeon]|nr:AMP-binding protein [Candidatus Lokiarchaeota archaeon]